TIGAAEQLRINSNVVGRGTSDLLGRSIPTLAVSRRLDAARVSAASKHSYTLRKGPCQRRLRSPTCNCRCRCDRAGHRPCKDLEMLRPRNRAPGTCCTSGNHPDSPREPERHQLVWEGRSFHCRYDRAARLQGNCPATRCRQTKAPDTCCTSASCPG